VLERMGARLAPAAMPDAASAEADSASSLVPALNDDKTATMSLEMWLDRVVKKERAEAQACLSLSLVANAWCS
jgi:hypothetical protein